MTNRPTRRTILIATSATGATALVAACGGSDDNGGGDSASTTTTAPGQDGAGDKLADTADIPVGGGTIFKDQKVVVTQPQEGQFKAFSAICTHQQCLVGSVSDGTINCPCHGSKFKVADGSVANGPASKALKAVAIKVDGDAISKA